ncbi:aminodeoxychorismate lyase [Paenibacillus agaridevorans]|uniref:Endolytic murein transglycosylase n=1 Tax=Paenibacillus agaridevorans TaxID=171404 RepID=A0A2R5EPP1_9BACL|nr:MULTISPECIES: endolytic transglycosylase MltG [Paenibacillus]GBG08676.1 aminodeoxychorismate lyase [Paenibacillus agaridevorans]
MDKPEEKQAAGNEPNAVKATKTTTKKKRKKVRNRPKTWVISLWVVLSLLTIMLLGAGGVLYYVWSNLQPMPAGAVKQVAISRGMSANSVADTLEENGIIKNSFVFGYYLQLKDEGSRFQAGLYEMSPGMDNAAIIAKLNAGDTIAEETIRFTIPEGYTVLQIADKLAADGLINKEKFLDVAENGRSWANAESAQAIPDDDKLHKRLEGYLFPETYELKKDSTEEQIITRMLQETDRKLAALPEDWQDAMEASGRTLHEIMTIASLIEREVVVDEERALVSSVIYNRLAKPMRLQIDAAVQYALDEPKERLLTKDLEIDSPYNTYKNDGLPPGPIASPSLASIEAAIYPAQSDYLFYVTKKDGSQSHLFAKTYNEHLRNIDKSERGS